MRLEQLVGMLSKDADRVRHIPVHLAVLGAGHALDERPEVVEHGRNGSRGGCERLSEATKGGITVTLWVIVFRVDSDMRRNLLECFNESVTKGLRQVVDEVDDVAEDDLIMVNVIVRLFVTIVIIVVATGNLFELLGVLLSAALAVRLLLEELDDDVNNGSHLVLVSTWAELISNFRHVDDASLDDLLVVLALEHLKVEWEYDLVEELLDLSR